MENNDLTGKTYSQVKALLRELFGDKETELTFDRFIELINDPNTRVVGAWDGLVLAGMCVLVRVRTFSRTAYLLEEVVVRRSYRRQGIGLKLDAFVFALARDEDVPRIEGTTNYDNDAVWDMHLKAGFIDRRNKTILGLP